MPKVTFLPVNQTFEGRPGESILEIAIANDVPLQHACGGFCACTTCHIHVKEGLESLSTSEEDESERIERVQDLKPFSRLGCQAKLGKSDVTVEIKNLDW
jgi:2Fe-2S ferredoxin